MGTHLNEPISSFDVKVKSESHLGEAGVDVLLRNFGGLIPLLVIAFPGGILGWQMLAGWRERRRAQSARHTAALDVSIAVVTTLVICLVLVPVPGNRENMVQLVPGTDILPAFNNVESLWQVAGNLIMLTPLGALLPLRIPALRSLTKLTLITLFVSTVIELTQFAIQAGRVTSTDDILLNTLGAVAGAVLTQQWWKKPALVPTPAIPAQVRRHIPTTVLTRSLTNSESPVWVRNSVCQNSTLVHRDLTRQTASATASASGN